MSRKDPLKSQQLQTKLLHEMTIKKFTTQKKSSKKKDEKPAKTEVCACELMVFHALVCFIYLNEVTLKTQT
jgi:hypothetical protein